VTFDSSRFNTEVSSTAFDGCPFRLRSNQLPPNITIVAEDSKSSTAEDHSLIGNRFHNLDLIHRRSFSPLIKKHLRTFEDCKFIANIASTFFTTVDRYLDTSSNIELAIKTYRIPLLEDNPRRTSAWRELDVFIKMYHPCMIEFQGFSLGNYREGFKIATVYADGGSLKEVLNSKPSWWDWTTKSRTISGIVLCLRYLHSKGIIHRDLKPSNILIKGSDHNIRICDFNISRLVSIEQTFTQGIGTLQYMAPELYKTGEDDEGHCNPDQTGKIDVFSFGLILYEIILGKPVFPENLTAAQVMYQALGDTRAPIPGWIPAFVFQMISNCWSRHPKVRPTFNEILNILRENEFKISPECDSNLISSYVERIERIEIENEARSQKIFHFADH
jgi:serine/threonine protein kinase